MYEVQVEMLDPELNIERRRGRQGKRLNGVCGRGMIRSMMMIAYINPRVMVASDEPCASSHAPHRTPLRHRTWS
jgi:hypothetical protein